MSTRTIIICDICGSEDYEPEYVDVAAPVAIQAHVCTVGQCIGVPLVRCIKGIEDRLHEARGRTCLLDDWRSNS